MKLKWDFQEFDDFADRISNIKRFEDACKKVTVQLAKELHEMLFKMTPVKTGKLNAGWGEKGNYSYRIKEQNNGYEIELINDVPYALSVNDGHYSYNQYNVGGTPYEVKHRTVPYYQGKKDSTFVFGHFFVEKSVLTLENDSQLEKILYKELGKWFRWCVNG